MITRKAFWGLGFGSLLLFSVVAFGLVFCALVALARPAGALYRVTLNPETASTALSSAPAEDIPKDVMNDARQIAAAACKDEARAAEYTAQLIALYRETEGIDAVLVFSPGGWGTKSVEHSQGWSGIVTGLDGQLKPLGLNWKVLNYQRTPHKWYAKIDEAWAQARNYPDKAPDLARRLDFLTRHRPGLTVFLGSESNGAMFNDRVMAYLQNREPVYNIATGPPFYYQMKQLEHSLILDDNGEAPDSFSQGQVGVILRSNFSALFGLDGGNQPAGEVLGNLRAPGHYYGWDKPKVAADITDFVTGVLAG